MGRRLVENLFYFFLLLGKKIIALIVHEPNGEYLNEWENKLFDHS